MKFIKSIVAILFFTLMSANVFAEELQSSDSLVTLAKEFVKQTVTLEANDELKMTVTPPDGNLKLTACSTAIKSNFSEGGSKDHFNSVELSCNSPTIWKINLPVSVNIISNVVVAKHNIASHQIINEEDVDIAPIDKTHLYSGFFNNKENVMGQMSNQSIVAGMVLTKRNIQQPTIVHRNEVIDLIARNASITVSMKGVARSDGGLHDMIKAYNPSSKRMLDAIVVSQGRVEVIS